MGKVLWVREITPPPGWELDGNWHRVMKVETDHVVLSCGWQRVLDTHEQLETSGDLPEGRVCPTCKHIPTEKEQP